MKTLIVSHRNKGYVVKDDEQTEAMIDFRVVAGEGQYLPRITGLVAIGVYPSLREAMAAVGKTLNARVVFASEFDRVS